MQKPCCDRVSLLKKEGYISPVEFMQIGKDLVLILHVTQMDKNISGIMLNFCPFCGSDVKIDLLEESKSNE